MSVGRYFCVALPFILTVLSIICMLIAGLTGITNTNLYIFRIDVSNVSIDASMLAQMAGLEDNINDKISSQLNQLSRLEGRIDTSGVDPDVVEDLTNGDVSAEDASTILDGVSGIDDLNGITASDLGLANLYDFSLWGYCSTYEDGTHNCTKPEFNWAEGKFSGDGDEQSMMSKFQNIPGINDTVVPRIMDGLKAFEQLNKWTDVVFVIAMIGLGLELFIGLFTACSRAVSCITWVIAVIATLFVVAAAAMMTVMATVAVGTVEGAASDQGAHANYHKRFLATVWIGAAFAIASCSFWLFTICCCKPESRPYSKSRKGANEKFGATGSYQPLGEPHGNQQYGMQQRGGARADLAYEPYTHARSNV